MQQEYGVTIPADIERDDRILANLTARQLSILIPAGALVWMAYLATQTLVPLPVFAVFALPTLGAAAALALMERDGVTLDRLVVCALTQAFRPRRLVIAPDGVPALPAWATAATGSAPVVPAPLRLPARAIRPDGVIDLGAEGVAVLVACSTISFALRTPGEQAALVAAFGGWLNSLTGPAQIVVHAAPLDLAPAVSALRERAAGLPHPALEDAALDHAGFLDQLAATRDLLSRQVLVVIREPHTPAAAGGRGRDVDGAAVRALRRAEQAARALAAAGITAHLLNAGQATTMLAAASDPTGPPIGPGMAAPGDTITSSRAGAAR